MTDHSGDGRDRAGLGLDDWLTAYGRAHDEHVHTETNGLVVAGLINDAGARIGASWISESPLGQFVGTWGGWTRMYYYAVLATGPTVLVETRQIVHPHECSSTTCIALWRRLWDFTHTHPGVEYLRSVQLSGNPDHPLRLLVDREQYELERTVPGRVTPTDDLDRKWRSYVSVSGLTRRARTDNAGT